LTNSRRGEGDPVFAIAWAISDYWIARIWNGHHMDLETRSVPEKGEPPSLEFMGRPSDLGYESILDCESRLWC
jgi:hypothetical protein